MLQQRQQTVSLLSYCLAPIYNDTYLQSHQQPLSIFRQYHTFTRMNDILY